MQGNIIKKAILNGELSYFPVKINILKSLNMDMNLNISNTVDNKKLEEFVIKAIGDLGSSLGSMMIILGDRLGLYKAQSFWTHDVGGVGS